MSNPRLTILLPLSLLLASCAAPKVAYKPINGPDDEGWVKFRLAESIIRFEWGKTSAGIVNNDVINIVSVPVPHGTSKYGMDGTSRWGVLTTMSATFRGDSDLLQQVTIAVADKRQEAIKAAGSLVAVTGGLFAAGMKGGVEALPLGISVTNLLASPPVGCANAGAAPAAGKLDPDKAVVCSNLALDGTKDFVADLSIEAVPVDAIPAGKLGKSFVSGNFYYSACRALTITLRPTAVPPTRPSVSATVAIADPRFLETLRFPEKGTITVAPSCGANSLSQDAGLPTALDYLNTLASQAKAVKEALKGGSGTK